MSLGVWGDQVDEIMAEAGAFWQAGNLSALQHLEASIRRWLPASPCPNAAVIALGYVQAAMEMCHPQSRQEAEVMRVADYRKAWADDPEGMTDRRERIATLREQAAERSSNWLYE
jgi:hypothetical protein